MSHVKALLSGDGLLPFPHQAAGRADGEPARRQDLRGDRLGPHRAVQHGGQPGLRGTNAHARLAAKGGQICERQEIIVPTGPTLKGEQIIRLSREHTLELA